jgi:hypothetical protein
MPIPTTAAGKLTGNAFALPYEDLAGAPAVDAAAAAGLVNAMASAVVAVVVVVVLAEVLEAGAAVTAAPPPLANEGSARPVGIVVATTGVRGRLCSSASGVLCVCCLCG